MSPETINTIAGLLTLLVIVGVNVFTVMRGQKATRAFAASTEVIAKQTTAIPEQIGMQIDRQSDQFAGHLKGFLQIYSSAQNEFNQQLGALKNQVEQTRSELNDQREQSRRDRVNFEADLAAQKSQTDGALARVKELETVVRELERQVGEGNQQHADDLLTIDALRKELDNAQKLLTEAQTQLSENKAEMQQQISDLRERVRILEEQVAAMQAERDRLIEERDAAFQQRDAALAERDALKARFDQLQSEYNSLIAANTLRDNHIQALDAELARIKSTLPENKPAADGGAG